MGRMKAEAATKVREKRAKPDFNVYARRGAGSEYLTIGAAWWRRSDDGEEFLSAELNQIPVGFDGSFLLRKPPSDGE